MPIYWSIFIISLLFLGIGTVLRINKKLFAPSRYTYKPPLLLTLIPILYLVFFVSLRDEVLDTYAYILSFESMPTDWNMLLETIQDAPGKGFHLLSGIFKIAISENHYMWLALLCCVCTGCVFRVYYKRSLDLPLSFYLFIASTTFTWLLNGARQFLVACILFAFSDWLLQGKKWKYIFLIFLLSFIHSSCIFLIPICLLYSSDRIFGKGMILIVIGSIFGTIFSENILNIAMSAMEKDYSEALIAGTGSNIIRFVISAVPTLIVLYSFRTVKSKASTEIILAINMSLIGSCFFFVSTFTNGILVGRMPIFFTLYNFYLLPWLIATCFKTHASIIKVLCIGLYGFYFYYQMCIAWHGLPYVSNMLDIHY